MIKKKIAELTDLELLDMMDVPEGKLQKSVMARVTDINPEWAGFIGEMTDIVMGILEDRHGEDAAYQIWMNRFCK